MINLFVSYSGVDPESNEFHSNGFYEVEHVPCCKDDINKLNQAIILRESLKGFNVAAVCVLFFTPV